jgi:hypothetical protein
MKILFSSLIDLLYDVEFWFKWLLKELKTPTSNRTFSFGKNN